MPPGNDRVCDRESPASNKMGASQSAVQLRPQREPTALLNTGAGVIVRLPDPSGASTYEHNSRVSITPTSIIDVTGASKRSNDQQTRIAVVKPGERNQALKGSIVYLKKAPRSLPHNP